MARECYELLSKMIDGKLHYRCRLQLLKDRITPWKKNAKFCKKCLQKEQLKEIKKAVKKHKKKISLQV